METRSKTLFVLVYLCSISFIHVSTEEVEMRMVEEPINMGANGGEAVGGGSSLIPRVKPSNFSGPPHLKQLLGKCFSMTDASYKYEFCPFQNVTQHEQSMRWNPYSGILGIYQEWQIVNNTFKTMMMKFGDTCGDNSRSVSVSFLCGKRTKILSVTEPNTCQYSMNFSTPLVCHPHSMLVFPTLTEELQEDWNDLEGQLHRQEITPKGYFKKLHKIFEKAGYVLDPEKSSNQIQPEDKAFQSLDICKAEYKKLLDEVEMLRAMVETKEEQGLGNYQNYHNSINFEEQDEGPHLDDPFAL